MATKRRKLTPTRIGISPAALKAWREGDRAALRRAMALPPWSPEPFDVNGPEPPADAKGKLYGQEWPSVWALRKELIRLAGRPGRAD